MSLYRESSGQSLHQNLEHVRVPSLLVFPMATTVISLAFLWEAVGQGDSNPTCEHPLLPRPAGICGLRSHSPCMHSHPGSWFPTFCAHPMSLLDPWFIGSGFPAPVSPPQFSLPISGDSIPSSSHQLSLVHTGVSGGVSVQALVEG